MRYKFATQLGADLYGFEPDVKDSNWCIISRDNQKALLYMDSTLYDFLLLQIKIICKQAVYLKMKVPHQVKCTGELIIY